MTECHKQMPQYQSHKKVWALKIASCEIDEMNGTAVITPSNGAYPSFAVDAAYVNKHQPKVGGYYVAYDDGYRSWSPGDTFEGGYSLITETPA